MKMQTIIAFACFGLLISVESAGAQHAGARKEYSLKVSVHKEVRPRLTKEHVEEILEGASELLNHCNVAFKLNGPIKTFDNTPAIIRTSAHRDAVHEVEADVKVVVDIKSCRS